MNKICVVGSLNVDYTLVVVYLPKIVNQLKQRSF